MGGSDAPFLYPPCTPLSQRRVAYPYSNFNPKAATQASYQSLQDSRSPKPRSNGPLIQLDRPPVSSYMVVTDDGVSYTPKAYEDLQTRKRTRPDGKGPLINFNQHPDSWQTIIPRDVDYKPMPASTKTKVKSLRWVQFALRIMEEVGAAGLLVCMICFQNMPNVFSWIMRIVPAWDLIVTFYAIYHLFRPATARTPTSSASYHIFAIIMDLGFLPFYTIMSFNADENGQAGTARKDRWKSLLGKEIVTSDMIQATFIGAAVIAGLHLLSAFLDLWLIILFRKIGNLPPDVNPLEDNLTSRSTRSSKHRYKNSEATLTGDSWSEKKPAFLSGSTLGVDQQPGWSTTSRDADEANSNRIPLNHSRPKSNQVYSPHNPEKAGRSQQHFEQVKLYSQSNSARNSRADVSSPSRMFDQELSRHAVSPDPSEVIPLPPRFKDRSSRPNSAQLSSRDTEITDFAHTASPTLPNVALSQVVVQSQQEENLLSDNWYAVDDDSSTLASATMDHFESRDGRHGVVEMYDSLRPQPLKMNPPTPPPKDEDYPDPDDDQPAYPVIKRKPLAARSDAGNGDLDRNSTVQSKVTTASSVYSDDEEVDVKGSTPKRKYYGDLAAATRGVLGTVRYKKTATGTGRILSNETTKSTGTVDAAAMDSTGMSALGGYGYARFPSKQYNKRDRNGRVVSRTGVDIVEMADESSQGIRGRRDVSGKVAEEGRGGGWWSRRLY